MTTDLTDLTDKKRKPEKPRLDGCDYRRWCSVRLPLLVSKLLDNATQTLHRPYRATTIYPKNSENRIQYKTNWFAFIVEVHPVLQELKNQEN